MMGRKRWRERRGNPLRDSFDVEPAKPYDGPLITPTGARVFDPPTRVPADRYVAPDVLHGLPWHEAPYPGDLWHQDDADSAHEAWRCSVEACGRTPWRPHEPDPEPDPKPLPPGRLLCGSLYPDGTLCKVPAEIGHAHVIALDLHAELDLEATDQPVWSVEGRLLRLLRRPILAKDLAATLPHELGARLCDRLETLVQQARDEATLALSTAVVHETNAAIERLTLEAEAKRQEVTRERFGTPSRLG